METEHVRRLKEKKEEIEKALEKEALQAALKTKAGSKVEKLNFYEFSQNNSGGSFDVNEEVCHRLFVQAPDYITARNKALELGVYFDGVSNGNDCGCCGDRWHDYEELVDLSKEGTQTASVYNHYKKPEELWKARYGDFTSVEAPKWDENRKEFKGKVLTNTIELCAQFFANEYGWTTPDARIYYWGGKVKEVFKKEISEELRS